MAADIDRNREIIQRALQQTDDLALHFTYTDAAGQRTTRIVSPIRLVGSSRLKALCLLRKMPRQFQLSRMSDVRFVLTAEVQV